jgi:hypothetical protein
MDSGIDPESGHLGGVFRYLLNIINCGKNWETGKKMCSWERGVICIFPSPIALDGLPSL